MGDLAAFYAARLDEDETAAKAAPGERWQAFTEDDIAGASVYDDQWLLLNPVHYDHDNPLSNKPGATGPQYIQRARNELAAHIARHDPARALREVAAGRRFLARHQPRLLDRWQVCSNCCAVEHFEFSGDELSSVRWPCPDMRDRLAVHSDHPDYDPAWAVSG